MIIFLTLCLSGIVFLLVKVKVLPWNIWTKSSPATIMILLFIFLFIPMQWGAPGGAALVIRQSVAIVPNVAGEVIEVPVEPNEPLKQGDVLFKIDPRSFQYALDAKKAALAEAEQNVLQLQANVQAAKASVDQATAARNRSRQRYERAAKANEQGGTNPFSAQEIETRQQTFLSDEAALNRSIAGLKQSELAASSEIDGVNTTVARLRAEVDKATYDLEQTTVTAPTDGFVTFVALRPGARVAALPLSPVMAFIDTSETIVGVQFPQIYARYIERGQKAEVTFKAFPGQTLTATVVALIEATAEGQIQTSGSAAQAFPTVPGPFFVRLEMDDEEWATRLQAGAAGDAAIYTTSVTATHIIRKVMIRMTAWMNYIIPN